MTDAPADYTEGQVLRLVVAAGVAPAPAGVPLAHVYARPAQVGDGAAPQVATWRDLHERTLRYVRLTVDLPPEVYRTLVEAAASTSYQPCQLAAELVREALPRFPARRAA